MADDVTEPLSEAELAELEQLVSQASPSPWIASIEGRDHWSADAVILVGEPREEDMYVSRDGGPASKADLDFIATARNVLPRLIAEVRRLRGAARYLVRRRTVSRKRSACLGRFPGWRGRQARRTTHGQACAHTLDQFHRLFEHLDRR